MILAAQGERKQKPRFASFSPKQKRVLTWWTGPDCDRYDVVICDGAVRSGKTTAVAVSFILWAMESYQDTSFAMRTVARRSKGSAIEAPFLFKHGDYYYLFVSFDYCCRGLESNYNVVVGRSERIEGPYFDRNGREMATGGGTAVVSSDPDFVAIGHCAVYTFGKRDYFVAHGYSRTENGLSKLFLRELCWDDAGWPFLG